MIRLRDVSLRTNSTPSSSRTPLTMAAVMAAAATCWRSTASAARFTRQMSQRRGRRERDDAPAATARPAVPDDYDHRIELTTRTRSAGRGSRSTNTRRSTSTPRDHWLATLSHAERPDTPEHRERRQEGRPGSSNGREEPNTCRTSKVTTRHGRKSPTTRWQKSRMCTGPPPPPRRARSFKTQGGKKPRRSPPKKCNVAGEIHFWQRVTLVLTIASLTLLRHR